MKEEKTETEKFHIQPSVTLFSSSPIEMCYQLEELYSACRCVYYQHPADKCVCYGRPGHPIQRRTILVGYACQEHSFRSGAINGSATNVGIRTPNTVFLMRYCHRSLTLK